MIVDMKTGYPEVYQQLLLERNLNWLPQLQSMLKNKYIEYVLVGAAHLAGEDGLLALLQQKGFNVEQLKNK